MWVSKNGQLIKKYICVYAFVYIGEQSVTNTTTSTNTGAAGTGAV